MSTVTVAPHLWRALEVMSKDMNVEPSALCNQAVFAWLRINGYVVPGSVGQVAQATTPAQVLENTPEVQPPRRPAEVARPAPVAPVAPKVVEEPAAGVSEQTEGQRATSSAPKLERAELAPAGAAAVDPLSAAVKRISEIDESLARFTLPRAAWAKPDEDEDEDEDEARNEEDEGDEERDEAPEPDAPRAAAASSTGDEAAEAEPAEALIAVANTHPSPAVARREPETGERTVFVRASPVALYIERDNQKPIRVDSDRFVIGRGPHCDLIIDSPRVSREHVAITRKGIIFVLDDLGSSNGTWLNEARVKSRELENGDLILLGNEAVTFVIRPQE